MDREKGILINLYENVFHPQIPCRGLKASFFMGGPSGWLSFVDFLGDTNQKEHNQF